MTGILLSEIDPDIQEYISDSKCLTWENNVCVNLTPISSFLSTQPPEVIHSQKQTHFSTKGDDWLDVLCDELVEVYKERPGFRFSAIVFDDGPEYYIIVTIPEGGGTLVRTAKSRYVRTFQDPEIISEEVRV